MATQAELDEARAALHKLLIGKKVAKVSVNGRTMEYSEANRADLERYIANLEVSLGTSTQRRPARVYV